MKALHTNRCECARGPLSVWRCARWCPLCSPPLLVPAGEGGLERGVGRAGPAAHRGAQAERLRVFFPDEGEMKLAAGDAEGWPATGFRLDYLTRPTVLLDVGLDILKTPIAERCQPDDAAFICPYPSFNVNEILAVRELSDTVAAAAETPIVVFNGEIERLRSGYYPGVFYPKLARLSKEWLPGFEAAYYLRNFKGSRPGALFRAYPAPWQVWSRSPSDPGDVRLLHEQSDVLSLREAAEILQSGRA